MPVLILLLLLCQAAPAQLRSDPNEGSLSAVKPRIPEPMMFDLVRPLGAEKGEIEVNTLFEAPLSGSDRNLHWAPEVEVAFTESMALEFELPMSNASLSEYKFALQKTAGTWAGGKGIHGWQGILRVDRSEHFLNADLLYLNGVQFNDQWSLFTMNGFRRESTGIEQGFAAVSNTTLFHRRSKHLVYGLESNLKAGGPRKTSWLLMPQSHFRIFDNVNLQVGVGMETRRERGSRGVAGWRLIREF